MRGIVALVRAGWMTAVSYRLHFVVSLVSQVVAIVPVFFVARALQPVMADAIRHEGRQFFGFLVLGTVAVYFVTAAVTALPDALAAGIANGTLEALLSTPAPLPAVLAGMTGYEFTWTALRMLVVVAAAWILGAPVVWLRGPEAIVILALLVCAYLPVALFAGALILAFRTPGQLSYVVLLVSGLLGGVYYPTHVIPSWIRAVAAWVPMTYGLRALRRVLLEGASLRAVAGDVGILVMFAATLLALGAFAFGRALAYAKRAGTLAQY